MIFFTLYLNTDHLLINNIFLFDASIACGSKISTFIIISYPNSQLPIDNLNNNDNFMSIFFYSNIRFLYFTSACRSNIDLLNLFLNYNTLKLEIKRPNKYNKSIFILFDVIWLLLYNLMDDLSPFYCKFGYLLTHWFLRGYIVVIIYKKSCHLDKTIHNRQPIINLLSILWLFFRFDGFKYESRRQN